MGKTSAETATRFFELRKQRLKRKLNQQPRMSLKRGDRVEWRIEVPPWFAHGRVAAINGDRIIITTNGYGDCYFETHELSRLRRII